MNAEAIPAVASVTLSPEEIADRIAAYRGDGSFERDMAETWTRAGDIIAAVIRENGSRILAMLSLPHGGAIAGGSDAFIEHIIDTLRRLFTGRVDRDWVLTLAGRGAAIDRDGHSMPAIIAERANEFAAMTARLTAAFADDPAFVQRAISAIQRLYSYDTEIALAQIGATRRAEATAALSGESIRFRDEIGAILSSAVKDADQLRGQTAAASSSARGMLGKTSEVAAAAEQSAVAMREAAQTAAGLIRAIEEARSEVEVAAGVATRAADQSGAAVAVSEALSGHAQAIESILGLIRDIAGQTNLLALNATIEAARAGDAGRGFAVVAQEVKSLASQTARATDDIAAKITAIQTATRQTLDANGSIRDIVGEVQASAQRIREAMEAQAHTVTMITAAVDETALAADSMSGTIAAIRTDTESVASEIDALGESFRVVDKQMGRLEQTTGSFVEKIAA